MTTPNLPSLPVLAMHKSDWGCICQILGKPEWEETSFIPASCFYMQDTQLSDSRHSICLGKVTCHSPDAAQNSEGERHCTAHPT